MSVWGDIGGLRTDLLIYQVVSTETIKHRHSTAVNNCAECYGGKCNGTDK